MIALLCAFALISLAIPALTRRVGSRVFFVTALIPAAAFVYTVLQTPAVLSGTPATENIPWISQLQLDLSFRVDALSWLMSLVVTGVGTLVMLYCIKYFADSEEGLGRFAAVFLAFTGTMYGLVIADNVYLLFILWEATTVFSFLLIGHNTGRNHADPRRCPQQVGNHPVPVLASRGDGGADAGQRLPARRRNGASRHLPHRPSRARLR